MKKHKEKKVDEKLINAFFKSLGLDRKRKEMMIINSWNSFVGETIARSTEKIHIYNGVLFLRINSSIVRNELMMLKQNLIDVINQRLKEEIITDIVIR